VFKANDNEEKLRVVFYASAWTYSGNSLNQCLFSGPKLQRDEIAVLVLFWLSWYAFTADILNFVMLLKKILLIEDKNIFSNLIICWKYNYDVFFSLVFRIFSIMILGFLFNINS
jgi:hypothetical protein